jgi:hypothetical protein
MQCHEPPLHLPFSPSLICMSVQRIVRQTSSGRVYAPTYLADTRANVKPKKIVSDSLVVLIPAIAT